MVARGVAEMTSKISSEDEEDLAILWQKKPSAVRKSCGWLIGDDEALVEALRRERAWGMNEV
jgi:hypothetical protein